MPYQVLSTSRDLLAHSFYRRWVTGDLSFKELRDYATQYSHVVVRLPGWLRTTATCFRGHAMKLVEHAEEEDSHVLLWTDFALALGIGPGELLLSRPNRATAELLELGDQFSGSPIGVAVAWALEVQAPAVSVEKLRGLKAHYGIDVDNGGRYFEIHSTRDLAHATQLAGAIADLPAHQRQNAQRVADQVSDRLWDLLSSVERPSPKRTRRYGSPAAESRRLKP